MSDKPKEIWCYTGLYWSYKTDWSEGSWRDNDNCGGEKYVRADRIEALTAERDALAEKLEKAVGVTTAALDEIDALNTLPPDENGHQWRESDLLDQEVMHLRATLAQINGETDDQ